MKKKYIIVLSIIIVVATVSILTLVQVRSVRSGPQVSTPTPPLDKPPQPNSDSVNILPKMPTAIQPEVVDLAPQVPYEDKPAVVVQHPDGSRTMYLVDPDAIDAFIENLPEGDELKLVISPPSLMRTPEAP